MSQVLRLICRDCLYPTEPSPGGVAIFSTCDRCGGPLEAQPEESSAGDFETPLSLLLTPESIDSGSWRDPGPASTRSLEPVPPRSLGRFQLRELLGGGGFGQVFRAYDPRLDRVVALKVLKDTHPTGRVMERFFREARAAAQLDHPNLVPLLDAGRDQGRCWIAYQFVEGRTLSQYRELVGGMDFVIVARLVRALADALDHAHLRGVFHRDLKPSNIIMDNAGRPRLTDFGLARRVQLDVTLTMEGAVLGTPAYMSPEQASGQSHLADARSDVYSLGVVFYELLCGRRPGDLPSGVPAWRAEHRDELPITPPRACNRHIPRALDQICRKAMARDPADRYCTARDLANELDAWLSSRPRSRTTFLGSLVLGLLPGIVLLQLTRFTPGTADPSSPATARDQPRTEIASASAAQREGSDLIFQRPSAGSRIVAVSGKLLFHQADCITLTSTPREEQTEYPNRRAAIDAGLKACLLCRP